MALLRVSQVWAPVSLLEALGENLFPGSFRLWADSLLAGSPSPILEATHIPWFTDPFKASNGGLHLLESLWPSLLPHLSNCSAFRGRSDDVGSTRMTQATLAILKSAADFPESHLQSLHSSTYISAWLNDGDMGILEGTSLEFCRLQKDKRKTKREEFGPRELNPKEAWGWEWKWGWHP